MCVGLYLRAPMSSIQNLLVAALLAPPCMFTSLPVHAQAAPASDDAVELRNGGVVRGKILEVVPDDSLVIESAASGERKTFAWADIASYERAGSRTDLVPRADPAPAPAPAPAAPQGPEAGGFGAPILHIESSREADVQLYQVMSEIVAVGHNASLYGMTYRPVCTAPCDQPVDGSQGHSFFFGGDGVTGSSRFTLKNYAGGLTAQVKPGRKGLRVGGFVLAATGPSVILGGVLWLVFQGFRLTTFDEMGNEITRPRPSPAGPAALIAVGSAMLVGGIVMAVLGKTRFKLVPNRGVGLLRPLQF